MAMNPAADNKCKGSQLSPPDTGTFVPLPHQCEGNWIDFQLAAAKALLRPLRFEIARLKAKATPQRVHKARVALRRWFSVWSLLCDDGWEGRNFAAKVIKPMRLLLKSLGGLRDVDVSIELCGKYDGGASFIQELESRRKAARKKLAKAVRGFEVSDLVRTISAYLDKRAGKLRCKIEAPSGLETPFERFDRHLREHESRVAQMAQVADSVEELHELRLEIKKWRYLLTECLGVTNLDLVACQQLLGEIHDLDRLLEEIRDYKKFDLTHFEAVLEQARRECLANFESLRGNLPYGLRPGITSLSSSSLQDSGKSRCLSLDD